MNAYNFRCIARVILTHLTIAVIVACNTEGAIEDAGFTTGAEESTFVLDAHADDADADSTTGGDEGPAYVPCGYEGMLQEIYDMTELPTEPYETLSASVDCAFEGIRDASGVDVMALHNESFEIFVYHPQDEEGEWPEGLNERPAVFFGPGNGYELYVDGIGGPEVDHRYWGLIHDLVQDGFVVFGINPLDTAMSAGKRRAALACTMIWARDVYPESERLSEFMVLAGHSSSGYGAYLLTEHILEGVEGDHLPDESAIDEWQQCALMTYAQGYGGNVGSVPIVHRNAPPYLSMLGTLDEDTQTAGVRAYDNRYAESNYAEPNGATDDTDEVALVAHGRTHADWGGTSDGVHPLSPYYSTHFLRWQMMGDDASRRRFMDLIDVGVDSCAFDDVLEGLLDWGGSLQVYYSGCAETIPESEYYPDVCCDPPSETCSVPDLSLVGNQQKPLIFANFGQGARTGVDSNGGSRAVIDTMDRESDECAMWEGVEPQVGYVEVPLSNSTSGGSVVARISEIRLS